MRFRPRAKGRRVRREPGVMNGLEKKYAAELEAQLARGEIAWWKFDSFKIRLADNTFYTPDFIVMGIDAVVSFVEVKGHWEDDARVKIKVAAETYWMFQFVAIRSRQKKHGGGWVHEEF